uniref:uncharacterized protein LOC100425035 isoform X2 n=1 Tax=Macaca mulatta TaxID=9544 RepID=UPI0010A249BF|nr:uncharacterized protein LOC100425035 isoform X2 [Macaca mulatta]
MGYKRSSSTGRHTAPAKASSVPLAIFQRRSHEGRGGGEKQSRKNSARRPRRWSPRCQRFRTGSPSAPLPPELSVRAHGQTEVASIYLPQELGAAAAAHAPLQHEGAGRGQRGAPGVPGHRGACPGEAPVPRPFTPQLAWPLPPGRWEAWVGGGGGRVSPAPRAGQAWGLLAPLGPRCRAPRWEPAAAEARSGPMAALSQPACSQDRDRAVRGGSGVFSAQAGETNNENGRVDGRKVEMQPLVLCERSISPEPGCALLCSGKAHCTIDAAD